MALTRIRAQQISDIDYKQAVRVITVANVTLSGGAPSTVDGVTLVAGDRILVAGQNTGSQNGLYDVSVLGTGSNGTWVRTADGDVTGEIQAGMIVMVTEGTAYRDTQWKLTTNNPIIIGTTSLAFEQNSAYAFGNIYANGTAVLANAVGGTVTLTAGDNIAITGNNTTKTVTIGVTGLSLNSISNGSSNVNVVSSGGDVTIGVGGVGNVGVFSPTGLAITGDLSVSGNATLSGNILGDRIVNGTTSIEIQTASGNANISVGGTSNVAVFTTSGVAVTGLTATGNSTLGNLTITGSRTIDVGNNRISNLAEPSAGTDAATKDYVDSVSSSGFTIEDDTANTTVVSGGDTLELFGTANEVEVAVTATDRVTFGLPANVSISNALSAIGNVTGGNVLTGGVISATGNATAANLLTPGMASAAGNITGGNLISAGVVTAIGTITGGNVLTGGAVSATGNVTGNYFLGNGSQLTGITATSTEIINGTSNVSINAANANVTITVAGETDSSIFSPGSLFTGILAVPKTLTGNVVMAANSFGTIINGTVITGNLQIPDGTTVYTWTPS